jgi:hypothetical protein
MPKYYIQSGRVNLIVNAADAEGGALWAINRVVQQYLPAGDLGRSSADLASEPQPANGKIRANALTAAMDQFDAEIRVSELGLGRDDAGTLDTELTARLWLEISDALDWLMNQLN